MKEKGENKNSMEVPQALAKKTITIPLSFIIFFCVKWCDV